MNPTAEQPRTWSRMRRSPAVLRLTGSVVVSQVGTQVTLLALPLLALLQLHSGAGVVGLLTAAEYVPWLLLALPAGAAADSLAAREQRRTLVACDVVRAALLASVPFFHALGVLTTPLLLAVVLLVGSAGVLAQVTSGALVPRVVERGLLTHVNGLLEAAAAVAMVVGPALAGLLVATLGAAQAVVADAVSFIASALLLARLPARENQPREEQGAARERWRDLADEGISTLRESPVLGRLCVWSTSSNLAGNALTPVVLTLVVRDAQLPAALLGTSLAVAALGGVLGAVVSAPLAIRMGHGRFVAASAVVLGVGILGVGALGLAGPPHGVALAAWLTAAYAVVLAANVAGNAQVATVRQHLVPEGRLARVLAAWRLLGYAGIPVGAVLGGALADVVGLRPVVVGAALAFAATCVLPLAEPVRTLVLVLDREGQEAPAV